MTALCGPVSNAFQKSRTQYRLRMPSPSHVTTTRDRPTAAGEGLCVTASEHRMSITRQHAGKKARYRGPSNNCRAAPSMNRLLVTR